MHRKGASTQKKVMDRKGIPGHIIPEMKSAEREDWCQGRGEHQEMY